jgi:hypothetical protein
VFQKNCQVFFLFFLFFFKKHKKSAIFEQTLSTFKYFPMNKYTIQFIFFTYLLCATLQIVAQTNYQIHFKGHTEFFEDNFKDYKNLQTLLTQNVNGRVYGYLQFYAIPSQTERKLMEAKGIDFLSYFQFGTYLISAPETMNWADLSNFNLRSLINIAPEWKLAASLTEKPYGAWAIRSNLIEVNVQVYENIKIDDAAEWLQQSGVKIIKKGTQNGFLKVRFNPEKIIEIAKLPYIRYMELIPAPGKPEDTGGRSLHRANRLDSDAPMGNHYNGAGQKVLTRDDGAVGPHIDFQGRMHNEPIDYGGNHGDGVTGIIGGAGNLDPTYKGMAAGADLYVVDYINDFQDNTLPLHQIDGVNATNSSYSDGCNAGYTMTSQTVDMQIYQNPQLMHVFSAGNAGGSDCNYGAGSQWGNITGGHKMAKNAIATANLFADGVLEVTSSRGPAYDGRIKPDIAAHGETQGSTDADNKYQVFGGTSGAAPGIAGCYTQLGQAFMSIENGIEAPSALLKATMLVTANDLGNKGPDFSFGWGHINANHALRLLEQKNWLQSSIDQAGLATFVVEVPTDVKEARWMLYWADPAANESAAKSLINDLDLTVLQPSGTIAEPWLLNSAPNATTLGNPAGHGRDFLNNMEEVSLDNPIAGSYILQVKGFEVPLGPQQFFLVWEYLTDAIEITYPSGGEGFVPNEIERIHWDAIGDIDSFLLEYSIENGANWINIANLTPNSRMYEWIVPTTLTANAKLRLTRGNQTNITEFPFSIAPLSDPIAVSRVCPDSMTLQCSDFDVLSVNIYLLGQKYMELQGSTSTNFLVIPIQNPLDKQWIAGEVTNLNGMKGRRNVATYYGGGLLNCTQQFDANMVEILSPNATLVQCNPFSSTVKARLRNDGLNPITGATISYKLGNQTIVTEAIPTIGVNGVLEYTFQQSINFTQNGLNTLKIWSNFGADNANFNDTLVQILNVVVTPENSTYEQNFENTVNPPLGWFINNPDDARTWEEFTMVDVDDQITKGFGVDFYSYATRGEEDFLYTLPVNLTGLNNPALIFDLAKSGYDDTYADGLRIEVLNNCDYNANPIVVYSKFDPQLGTVTPSTTEFFPTLGSDWRTEIVPLSAFAGQNIILRFVSTNDYGNNMFLDNIRFENYDISPPDAAFVVPDTLCRLDTVQISSQLVGNFTTYQWSFGAQASPSSANGPGPHDVRYLTSGIKSVSLIAINSLGADTLKQVISVLSNATANFSTNINQNTVQFNNTSINASGYLWDFGDGNGSTEKNPLHTYAATGTYNVKLISSNFCKTAEKNNAVIITTVGIENLDNQDVINILPNPNQGVFNLIYQSKVSEKLQLELIDAQGKLLEKTDFQVSQGANLKSWGRKDLATGAYSLKVLGNDGVKVLRLVVQ